MIVLFIAHSTLKSLKGKRSSSLAFLIWNSMS